MSAVSYRAIVELWSACRSGEGRAIVRAVKGLNLGEVRHVTPDESGAGGNGNLFRLLTAVRAAAINPMSPTRARDLARLLRLPTSVSVEPPGKQDPKDWLAVVLDGLATSPVFTGREEIADPFDFCARSAQDLVSHVCLCGAPVVQSAKMWVLLVDGDRSAVGQLELEAIANGSGRVFADPIHALREVGPAFRQSVANALSWVRTASPFDGFDIRLRLAVIDTTAPGSWDLMEGERGLRPIDGGSAGAAVAMGLAHLVAQLRPGLNADLTRTIDPRTLAITASVGDNGRLLKVVGLGVKVTGILEGLRQRGVTLVAVATAQEDRGQFHLDTTERQFEGADLRIVDAPTLSDLLYRLSEKATQTAAARTPDLVDFSGELEQHRELFARRSILTLLDEQLFDKMSSWVILTGSPGVGKSAILARFTAILEARAPSNAERLPPRDATVVHYFIKRHYQGWDKPKRVVRHIHARLCELFPGSARQGEAPERLQSLLRRISETLSGKHRLIIVIDAIDELEDKRTTTLSELFPDPLPERVSFLLSMRNDPTLRTFFNRGSSFVADLDAPGLATLNASAVQEYWQRRRTDFTPPLGQPFVDAMVQAAAGNMLVAVLWFRRLRSNQSLRNDPSLTKKLPRDLKDFYGQQWSLMQRDEAGGQLATKGLRLLCEAREPLSASVIQDKLNWSPEELETFLKVVGPFTRGGSDDSYSLYHDTFRSFIAERLLIKRTQRRRLLTAVAAGLVVLGASVVAARAMSGKAAYTDAPTLEEDERSSVLGSLPRLLNTDVNGRLVAWTISDRDNADNPFGTTDGHYQALVPPKQQAEQGFHPSYFGPPNGIYFVFHNYGTELRNIRAVINVPCSLAVAEERGGARVVVSGAGHPRRLAPRNAYSDQDCGEYQHPVTIENMPTGSEVVFAAGWRCSISGMNCSGSGISENPPEHENVTIASVEVAGSDGATRTPLAVDLTHDLLRGAEHSNTAGRLLGLLSQTRSWLVQHRLLHSLAQAGNIQTSATACEIAARPLTEFRVREMAVEVLSTLRAEGWGQCVQRALRIEPLSMKAMHSDATASFLPLYIQLLREMSTSEKHLPSILNVGTRYASASHCGELYRAFAEHFAKNNSTLRHHMANPEFNFARDPAAIERFLTDGLKCADLSEGRERAFIEAELCETMDSGSERHEWGALKTTNAAAAEDFYFRCFTGMGVSHHDLRKVNDDFRTRQILKALPNDLASDRWRAFAEELVSTQTEERAEVRLAIAAELFSKLGAEQRRRAARNAGWRAAAKRLYEHASVSPNDSQRYLSLAITLTGQLDQATRRVTLGTAWIQKLSDRTDALSNYFSTIAREKLSLPKETFSFALKHMNPKDRNVRYALFRVVPSSAFTGLEAYHLWLGGEEHARDLVIDKLKASPELSATISTRIFSDVQKRTSARPGLEDAINLLKAVSTRAGCQLATDAMAATDDANERTRILRASSSIECGLAPLLRAVSDASPLVRSAAVDGLSNALTVDSTTKQRRPDVVAAQGEIFGALMKLIQDPDKTVRERAVRTRCGTSYVNEFTELFREASKKNIRFAFECMLAWPYWEKDPTGSSKPLIELEVPSVLTSIMSGSDPTLCERAAKWAGEHCVGGAAATLAKVSSASSGNCAEAAATAADLLKACQAGPTRH